MCQEKRMESSKVSQENQGNLREEGELSDDDNDEDALNLGHSYHRSSLPSRIHDDIAVILSHSDRSHSQSSSRGESPFTSHRSAYRHSPFDKERYSRNSAASRHGKHCGRKSRGYSFERNEMEYRRMDRQAINISTPSPSSKIWENRRFRASSVRPRTPPSKTAVGVHENQHELFELVKEQERIREQLQSLEEEEKRSFNLNNNNLDGDDKGPCSEDDYILHMIERFPDKQLSSECVSSSPKHASVPSAAGNLQALTLTDGSQAKSTVIEVEDISDEEDFDEQKLRILALATSARHNQLLAKGIQNKSSPVKVHDTPVAKEREPVVVIPDLEPEVLVTEVVVVPEDEENAQETVKSVIPATKEKTSSTGDAKTKNAGKNQGKTQASTSKDSKEKGKSRSKRRKKGSSKQESKKREPDHRSKVKLSTKEWAQQQKLLKVLALKDPQQAIEKFLKLAKVGDLKSKPAPPKLTGTMGDFKRQKHLPLLSESQKQAALDKRSKGHEKNKKGSDKKRTDVLEDNYEEVEMDIASDCEDKVVSKQSNDPALERLNLGADFSQAMQPIPMMPYVPSQMDAGMLSSMTSVYQVQPSFPHISASIDLGSSAMAPPLPHQPPPLPPPPPPPPLPVDLSVYGKAIPGTMYNNYSKDTGTYSAKMSSDNQNYQGLPESHPNFSPDQGSISYFSPSKGAVGLEEGSRRAKESQSFSIADIGSQLHRLRKEQDRVRKSTTHESDDQERARKPISHESEDHDRSRKAKLFDIDDSRSYSPSDSTDLSKGFWLKEDSKKPSDYMMEPLRRRQRKTTESPESFGKPMEDEEYSPYDSTFHPGGRDGLSHQAMEYKPSPKLRVHSSEFQDTSDPYIPERSSSSTSSLSPSQRQRIGRKNDNQSSDPDNRHPFHQSNSFETDDTEKDNSEDENELRKQLLTSLVIKRLTATVAQQLQLQADSSESREPKPSDDKDDNDNDSDEEPVPPPVVKRIWIQPSTSTAHTDHTKKEEFDEFKVNSPQSVENQFPLRRDEESVSGPRENPQLDVIIRTSPDMSQKKEEAGMESYNSAIPAAPSPGLSNASETVKQPCNETPRPPQVQASPMDPRISPHSRILSSSRNASPSRVQSPSLTVEPMVAKSVSPLSSTMIKTIYSSSQSLPNFKSTMSNASGAASQKERSHRKAAEQQVMDPLRSSSPSTMVIENTTSFTSHSPATDAKEVTTRHQKKFSNIGMPIHPSVIVPLHPSSDEEDGEETIQSSGDDNHGSSSGHSNMGLKLIAEEKLLMAHKKEIVSDQERLRRLLTKAGDALRAQRQAEERREFVQAQIAVLLEKERAISRMAGAQEQLKDKIKTEARVVKNRLLKNKPLFIEKTKSVMELGRAIVGPDFIPKALRASPKTQDVKDGSVPQQVLSKSEKIAIEKQKLRKKEQEIAEKLKVLKESTNSGTAVKRDAASAFVQEKPSDVIRLGQENVDALLPRKRKRSRLSTDASKTPNLPMTPKTPTASKSRMDFSQVGQAADVGNNVPVFRMPQGSQLSNLRKILVEEKVEKVLSNKAKNVECLEQDFYSVLNNAEKTGQLNFAPTDEKKRQQSHETLSLPVSLTYSSPLKVLRSYRFSKFYRTKEALSLTSKTFSHKINPNCIMCPYDIQGICNDDKCQQQHPADYELTDHEVLEDLVSYHPELTGIKSGATRETVRKAVGSYVHAFLAKHKDKLTLEEMCLLLTSEVFKVVHRSQALCTKARQWKLEAKDEIGLNVHLEPQLSFKNQLLFDVDRSGPANKDEHVGEEDLRYFVTEGTDALSLEEAVLENPQEINLWLQLSARRLADPNRNPKECLDLALNVLARALEANRTNSELWLRYLTLYQRHSEVSDFPQFCQTALDYHEKESACQKALDFLCQNASNIVEPPSRDTFPNGCDMDSNSYQSPQRLSQEKCDMDKMSHQILEMIIYYTNLNILSGRFKTAIKFLQGILGEKEGNESKTIIVRKHLTEYHMLSLWMIYIHVVEWRQLPKDLFPGANENPGRIITQQFSLPWSSKPKLYTPLKTLVNLHRTAAKVWTLGSQDDHEAEKQYIRLIESLVSLLCTQQSFDEALSMCLKTLSGSNSVDIWLTTAAVHAAKQDFREVEKVFKEAISKINHSAKLQFYQNAFLCSQGKSEEALSNLEQFIISCFNGSRQSKHHLDPNLLFCQLLNLQEGFSLQVLARPNPEINANFTQDVFTWMCYCQLLELQGEKEETIEVFERSLTQVQSPSDLILVWQSYISFLLRSNYTSNTSSMLRDLLIRSVISTPTKLLLPFSPSGASVVDYRHSNQLVDIWLSVCPSDQKLEVIEKCLDCMPSNVPLLMRGLELCIAMKETRRAFCWCKMMAVQSEKPVCLAFWKIASALAYSEGTQRELLLFEVTREDGEIVSQILSQCDALGLNIQDYVQTLSAKVITQSNT